MAAQNEAPPDIYSLPNEILHLIISLCPSSSIYALRRTSHRFHELVNDNRIWSELCRNELYYWSPEHKIDDLWLHHPGDTNWRRLFEQRKRKHDEVLTLLNSILRSQSGRIDKIQRIVDLGYDAKDCLIKQRAVTEDTEDWLARRWYSDAVLGCLHRSMAIKEWSSKLDGERALERALGAFDMFVLHDRVGDFNEIKQRLDSIARAIITEDDDFNTKTIRQKTLAIASYLTRHGLVGIRGDHEETYHDLKNNFIGVALHDAEPSALPLQSTAIYCSVARRLGINASPCALPFHVFVIVRPPPGMTLNDETIPTNNTDNQDMFLDPFDTPNEIDISVLNARLHSVGTPPHLYKSYFEPAPITDLVIRTGRNILTSIQESHRRLAILASRNAAFIAVPSEEARHPIYSDIEGAFYGALWSALLFGRPSNGDGPVMATLNTRAYLPPFLERFEANFPLDAGLLERYILPIFHEAPESDQLRESIRVMRSVDVMPKIVKSRTDQEISQRVLHRVGQVFSHKRYNYVAVITGWDVKCNAGERWMERMRVHELPKGGDQSFYHCLVDDKSVRYVAEENIEIITPDEPKALMGLAGKYFKRWDHVTHRFVSNIKDEYPDD